MAGEFEKSQNSYYGKEFKNVSILNVFEIVLEQPVIMKT